MASVTFADNSGVSLEDAEPPAQGDGTVPDPVSLNDAQPGPPLPSAVIARSRALKADVALGSGSPGYDELVARLQSGQEQGIRSDINNQQMTDDRWRKLQLIHEIGAARDAPLSNEEAKNVLGAVRQPDGTYNLNTALEKTYSKKVLDNLYQMDMVKNVTEGWEKANPAALKVGFTLSSGQMAKNEMFRSVAEDANERANNQSIWSSVKTVGRDLVTMGLAESFTKYDALGPKTGLNFGGTPGENTERQIQYLHMLPIDQAHQLLTTVLAGMNPSDAHDFADKVVNFGHQDVLAQNFFDAANIAMIFGGFLPHKLPIGSYTPNPNNTPEMLSSVEKMIMGMRKSPVNFNGAGPFIDEFQILNRVEKELLKRRPSPLKIDALSAPGTIGSMEVGRPASSYEVFRAVRGTDQLNKPTLIGVSNSLQQVSNMGRDIVKAATEDAPPKIEKILTAVGETPKAARQVVSKEIENLGQGNMPTNPPPTGGGNSTGPNFTDRLHGILQTDRWTAGASNFNREAVTRLSNLWTSQAADMLGVLTDHVKFDRISPEAQNVAFTETEKMMRSRLVRNASNAVMDVIRTPNLNTVTNTSSVTMVLGRTDGTLFVGDRSYNKAYAAAQLAYRLDPQDFKIIQYGAGHAITITKNVDETTNGVRDILVDTLSHQAPVHWSNVVAGKFKSSVYTTSKDDTGNRNIAQSAVATLQNVAKDIASNWTKLSKTEKRAMTRVFEMDRDFESQGQIGRFAHSLGDFETNFFDLHKRLPSEKEAGMYFSFRNLNNFDYVARNLGFYRDLARIGTEDFRFKVPDPETGKGIYTDHFHAKEVSEIPFLNNASAGVFLHDDVYNVYHRTGSIPTEIREYINDRMKRGELRALQLLNPLERPLHDALTGHGGDYIHFVVTKDIQSKPIEFFNIPYHDGFHREYSATHYVKQAIISRTGGRQNYEGDLTILGAMSKAEASNYASRLTAARQLWRNNDVQGLKDYLSKNFGDPRLQDYDAFVNRFAAQGSKQVWHPTEPFVVVPSGNSVSQVEGKALAQRYGKEFHNEQDSPYNLMKNVDKKFIGSRDPSLWALRQQGSEQAPLFDLESAPQIDIMKSLNRTVSNALHQRVIQDYKISAAEHFVEQFANVLTPDVDTLRQNPLYHMLTPSWKSDTGGFFSAELATAKAARLNALQFIGMDSPDVKAIKYLQSKVVDGVYKAAGQAPSHYVADNLIGQIQDPTSYARAAAYHLKLGAYNALQFVNQMQAVVHSVALAGTEGLQGVMGATAMMRLQMTKNPAIVDWYSSAMTKAITGYKEGWFRESWEQLQRSGFNLVQGETSWRDDMKDVSLFRSGWGKFLDAGAVFFRGGEQVARFTAWNAAYLEFKKVNPSKIIDDIDIKGILSRANQLNVDMTKAAQAPIQQGLLSIPTQFWGYQWRLAEQLNPLSSRLTVGEKLRAYSVYSAMYGIPVTAGAVTAVWPAYESIRQYALENNLNWDKTHIGYALMEGLPAYIMSSVTGKDLGQKYGPQGISTFRDYLHGSKTAGEVIGGVSGTTLKDVGKALSPIWSGVYQAITEGNPKFWDSADYPLVSQDITDALSNVASFSAAQKDYYAWNYKSYYTKGGTKVNAEDMDAMDAAIMTAFGLSPRKVSDTFLMMDSNKQQKVIWDQAEQEIKKNVHLSLERAAQGDDEGSAKYLSRARSHFIGAGFTDDHWGRVFKDISVMPLGTTIPWDFYLKNAPKQRKQDFLNQQMGQ